MDIYKSSTLSLRAVSYNGKSLRKCEALKAAERGVRGIEQLAGLWYRQSGWIEGFGEIFHLTAQVGRTQRMGNEARRVSVDWGVDWGGGHSQHQGLLYRIPDLAGAGRRRDQIRMAGTCKRVVRGKSTSFLIQILV